MINAASVAIIRAKLSEALSARADADKAASSSLSNAAWETFDRAVDQLLEALEQSESSGLLERFERLGVTASALAPCAATTSVEPA